MLITENQHPLVTIIVPVYNSEKYLTKCLDSLARQTYENVEIIIIDDGSTDSSNHICNEFAKEHASLDIRVIRQANAGQAAARNLTIRLAKGDYCAFLDSDDLLGEDAIKYLVDVSTERSADLVCAAYKSFSDDGLVNFHANEDYTCKNITKQEAIELFCLGFIPATAWAKLIKNILQKCEFPAGMIYEDSAIVFNTAI